MKKLSLSAVCILCAMLCKASRMDENKILEWNRLMSEGSNYIICATSNVSADGRKVWRCTSPDRQNGSKEMERWFSEILAYSIPTNDMVNYADMLRSKTMMVYLTAWRMDSVKSWHSLARFLVDIKNKKLPKSVERRKKNKEKYRFNDGSFNIGAFRKRLYHESQYQSALNHAELMMIKAFTNLLRQSSEEKKNRLIEILSEIVGHDFAMKLIEQKESTKRSANKR